MFDVVSRSDGQVRQRAIGSLRIGFKLRGTETVLDRLYQQGCLKARLPAVEAGAWRTAVTLNSSGGVAGGDRLDTSISLADGCSATITAQAAERFYRVLPDGGPAMVRTALSIGADSAAEWLPQETILYDRCALERRLDIDMAKDARFLGVEMLVFGRLAMGETVRTGFLRDLIRVRRDGRLVWHDAIRMEGGIDALLRRTAIANGARALATIVYVGADADDRLNAVRGLASDEIAANGTTGDTRVVDAPAIGWSAGRRACPSVMAGEGPPSTTSAIDDAGTEIASSAWDGMLITRVLSSTSASLRLSVTQVLSVLRDARPLPRVWLC